MELKGKSVVVIGGLGGIGYATSELLLTKLILQLAILDVRDDPEAVKQLSIGHPNSKVKFLKMDITKKSEIDGCFKKIWTDFNGFDILINSGGVVRERDPRATIETNLDEFYYNKTGVGLVAICPGITLTPLMIGIDDCLTFPYSKPVGELSLISTQTCDQCAVNLVKAIEFNKNGSIWICDLRQLKEVKPVNYWMPTLENVPTKK